MYRHAIFIILTLFSGVVGAQQLTFNLGWLPQGSLSGVIIAIELGYYTELGLEVDAVRGYGGSRTVNEIDQGRFALGYGDPISVALNRARGGEARLVSAINTRWPAGLCFVLENHEVEGLDDIAGRSRVSLGSRGRGRLIGISSTIRPGRLESIKTRSANNTASSMLCVTRSTL